MLLNCKGKLTELSTPLVMGIINITPDSFYRGYLDNGLDTIVSMAVKMLTEGAAILDIGGQSTRPGSSRLSPDLELQRVIPVINALVKEIPGVLLSIDTYSAKVADKAIEAGAKIINDVSGGLLDPDILNVAARYKVPYICMHMKGTPENMQQQPYYDNVTSELLNYFHQRLEACYKAGITDVVIDPGFGFGKNAQHNFQLLKDIAVFKQLKVPVLMGISRKSTIYKTLGVTAEEALNGTTVLHTISLLNGADIIRVHDVKEAVECIKLVQLYKKTAP